MDALKRMLFGLLLFIAAGAAQASETYSKATLTEDGRAVTAITFSADGAKIALALDDASTRVKDTAGGEGVLLEWEGHPAYLVAFSPDGTRLALATVDYKLRIWDVAAAREIAVLDPPREQLYAIAFSPDGTRLVDAAGDGTARIWDLASGRGIAVLLGHADDVLDAAFSPDGTQIVTASRDKTARLWDTASAREIARLDHSETVNAAAFSADGTRLVTGANNGSAHIFDVATGGEILLLKADMNDVLDVNFSADGRRVVTGSYDRAARIWNAASGEMVATLIGHLAEVYYAAFSPDGERILTAARDGSGRIWTKLPPARMPDGVAGLWTRDLTTPEKMPDDFFRYMCLSNPINVHGDGLVVSFMGETEAEPPNAMLHLRCASDLTCQVFAGPPAQGLEPQGVAKISFKGDAGELCLPGECGVIARCPDIAWTDEEKRSSFAEAWEAKVLAPQ